MKVRKPNPISLRLTDSALAAIQECTELSGLQRSAVVEQAIRLYLLELSSQKEKLQNSQNRTRQSIANAILLK